MARATHIYEELNILPETWLRTIMNIMAQLDSQWLDMRYSAPKQYVALDNQSRPSYLIFSPSLFMPSPV